MAEASQHGLVVSKPWGDSERYDVGVEHNGQYQRVQVKSLTHRSESIVPLLDRFHGRSRAYKSSELDFFRDLHCSGGTCGTSCRCRWHWRPASKPFV